MLGYGGGSLFPSGLVCSEDKPEPRQSGQASPGLWECGSPAGDPGEQEWAGRAGEARGGATRGQNARAGPLAGRRGAHPGSSPKREKITDPGRSSFPGRCRSRGPPGTPRAVGRCPGRWEVGAGRPGAAVRWLGWVSPRTLSGLSCGFSPLPPTEKAWDWRWSSSLGGEVPAARVPPPPQSLPRGWKDGRRMRRQGKPFAGTRPL